MNSNRNLNMLLDAIGKIDDAYIVSAQNRASLLPGDVPSSVTKAPVTGFSPFRSAPHRAALTAAAIVILLLTSFTAAMAANEDFRNAVFRFFRISTPDVVLPIEEESLPSGSESLDSASSDSTSSDNASPGDTGQSGSADSADIAEIENIGNTNIGDAVSVEYLRIDGIFDYCDGAVYLYEPWEGYDDGYDAQTRYAAAAYAVEDGQMVLLEPHYETLSYPQGNTAQGTAWQIRFDWYEKDGILYANARNYDPAASMEWSVSAAKGSSDFLILTLGFGQQTEYTQYPLLYNVRTKELLDVLAWCRLPEGQRITQTDFSPNLSRILITCDNGAAVYWYDIAEENLVSLNEVSGLEELEASFLDDNTLCCLSIDESGRYHCRTIEMPSGKCTERFLNLPRLEGDSHSGIALTGGRYGLYVCEDMSVFVYDFKTGDYAAVEDFKYPEDAVFLTMNPAEDKILFIQETPEADGLGISQLGVLNLASRTFVLLDREGYETRRETSVGWFDHDRVAIRADAKGVGYLYLYTVSPLPVN